MEVKVCRRAKSELLTDSEGFQSHLNLRSRDICREKCEEMSLEFSGEWMMHEWKGLRLATNSENLQTYRNRRCWKTVDLKSELYCFFEA